MSILISFRNLENNVSDCIAKIELPLKLALKKPSVSLKCLGLMESVRKKKKKRKRKKKKKWDGLYNIKACNGGQWAQQHTGMEKMQFSHPRDP